MIPSPRERPAPLFTWLEYGLFSCRPVKTGEAEAGRLNNPGRSRQDQQEKFQLLQAPGRYVSAGGYGEVEIMFIPPSPDAAKHIFARQGVSDREAANEVAGVVRWGDVSLHVIGRVGEGADTGVVFPIAGLEDDFFIPGIMALCQPIDGAEAVRAFRFQKVVRVVFRSVQAINEAACVQILDADVVGEAGVCAQGQFVPRSERKRRHVRGVPF